MPDHGLERRNLILSLSAIRDTLLTTTHTEQKGELEIKPNQSRLQLFLLFSTTLGQNGDKHIFMLLNGLKECEIRMYRLQFDWPKFNGETCNAKLFLTQDYYMKNCTK